MTQTTSPAFRAALAALGEPAPPLPPLRPGAGPKERRDYDQASAARTEWGRRREAAVRVIAAEAHVNPDACPPDGRGGLVPVDKLTDAQRADVIRASVAAGHRCACEEAPPEAVAAHAAHLAGQVTHLLRRQGVKRGTVAALHKAAVELADAVPGTSKPHKLARALWTVQDANEALGVLVSYALELATSAHASQGAPAPAEAPAPSSSKAGKASSSKGGKASPSKAPDGGQDPDPDPNP